MKRHRLIIVDDEKDMRDLLEIRLRKEGHDARGVESAQLALDEIREHGADLVISDVKMPGIGGLEFLKRLREMDPSALVIMITAYASVETAIEAMKAGAYDYFIKPFNIDEENLTGGELFGHVKGAFTGALAQREGLAEQADGGTLFLDEITELPLHLQVKLLRFIQERSFRRVGGTSDISVDIRLVVASNREVEAEVRAGRFREDLFYRLNFIRIHTPALRDRKEDIPLLARHFLNKYNQALGKDMKGFSEEAMRLIIDHDYSGNVRELENIIERAVTLGQSDEVGPEGLPWPPLGTSPGDKGA